MALNPRVGQIHNEEKPGDLIRVDQDDLASLITTRVPLQGQAV